jgi:hypothetical protein
MDFVVSEIDVRDRSLYRDWDSLDQMVVSSAMLEAQGTVFGYLNEPYSSQSIPELRSMKILYNALVILTCAYIYRYKSAQATEEKVTEAVGPLSETATSKNTDFIKLYIMWENLAWRMLLPFINTMTPPVADPSSFAKQAPTYIERNPEGYQNTLAGVVGNVRPTIGVVIDLTADRVV